MQALVAGATGETGRRIVAQLQERGIQVRALVRDMESAKAILPDGVDLVIADVLKPDTLRPALTGCQFVLCATGARPSFDITGPYQVDFVGTQNLVNAAKEAGIEQFVLVSSLCVSNFFHPLNLFWLVLYWKQQAEAYLRDSGLTYTIVRPGGLRNEDSPAGIVMNSADTLFEGSISRVKVAQVCVEALFVPEARNKTVEIVAREAVPAQSFEALFASVG
jgi:uncharacterized protein YbjT (DUF2867 family)